MTDSEKLRNLAYYFDMQDSKHLFSEGFEVQVDLRRIADELEHNHPFHQTNSLLIAMLESQLKVNMARKDAMLSYSNSSLGVNYVLTLTTIEELERQLKELKG